MSDEFAWSRTAPACLVREALLSALFRPLIALYARRRVVGVENLAGLAGPVVFVANHSSHMDTPLILRALPWSWRRRTATAAAADYFYNRRLTANAVSLAFNTVRVERNGARRDGVSLLDDVLAEGWSVVVFAEGTRSRDGSVGALHSGAAVLAAQHNIPIVPIYVAGTYSTMPRGRRWMRRASRGRRQDVSVAFGPPIPPRPPAERREVMEQVRLFFASHGATTTPNKRIAARRRALTTSVR